MNFDAMTAAAVRAEIEAELLGGRVERVLLPADLSVALEVFARGKKRWLFATADPQQARVHLTGERLARASENVTPLLLLMRKHVRDARLIAVDQPAWERTIALGFEKKGEDGELRACTLIIEVMGRHSNIVLVNAEGRILEAVKRVTPDMSRYRVVLPQRPYQPPPVQAKQPPDKLARGELEGMVATAQPGSPAWEALVKNLAGFGPLLAREVVYRASGDARASVERVPWDEAERVVHQLVSEAAAGNWAPCWGMEGDQPVAYAPYRLTQFAESRTFDSISMALEEYYGQRSRPTRAGETGKAQLYATIASLVERTEARRRSLRASLADAEAIEHLRARGELLLAFGHDLDLSTGVVEVEGAKIEVDPSRSPVDNAQRYFREYRKAKASAEEVPPRLREAELELSFLAQVKTDLDLATGIAEVEEVRQELMAVGLLRQPTTGKKKAKPRSLPMGAPIKSTDGFDILIGRSARQNEMVTFERGVPEDIWLHARGLAGAHVLVRSAGRAVPETTLREAAAYAAYFSEGRGSVRVSVDYTLRRHVRRVKGGPPGLVNYSDERTLQVKPMPPPKPGG